MEKVKEPYLQRLRKFFKTQSLAKLKRRNFCVYVLSSTNNIQELEIISETPAVPGANLRDVFYTNSGTVALIKRIEDVLQ